MRTNIKNTVAPVLTEGGARAYPHLTAYQQLRRTLLACLLWEDSFYEDGQSISDRIQSLCKEISLEQLSALAIEARTEQNLRHAPLLIIREMARRPLGGKLVGDTIAKVIQRADELAEFVSLYFGGSDRRVTGQKLSKQVKRGLVLAFNKFDAYQLAKYDRDYGVSLQDVIYLVHAKPRTTDGMVANATPIDKPKYKRGKAQRHLSSDLHNLVAGTLPTPDTWETQLSAGGDKKETFTRLLVEEKLGYLALLRNLRNMDKAGVDPQIVQDAILLRRGASRVLPFRYVAAARAAPRYEPVLDQALVSSLASMEPLGGVTAVLVDVSGSMGAALSAKSDLTRMDAAATLASIIPGNVRVFSFSDRTVEVPARKGMSGVDVITRSQTHSGTALFEAVALVNKNIKYDRIIVITDEQATDLSGFHGYGRGGITSLPDPMPGTKGYMINVASYQNGVGYGKWTSITGFSERVLKYIAELEGSSGEAGQDVA